MVLLERFFIGERLPLPEQLREVVKFFRETQQSATNEGLLAANLVAQKAEIEFGMAATAAAWSYGSINAGGQMDHIAAELAEREGKKVEDYLTTARIERIEKEDIGVVLVGLGKMGREVIQLLSERGLSVVGFDLDLRARDSVREMNLGRVTVYDSLEEAIGTAKDGHKGKTVILTLIPSQKFEQAAIEGEGSIASFLAEGDSIVDMGNTPFRWTLKHYRLMRDLYPGINFIDCGTSGGVGGARNGACLMVGCSNQETREAVAPVLAALAKDFRFVWVGGDGAGHLAKGFHNAAEYGLMQINAWLLGKFLAEGMTETQLYKLISDLQATEVQSYLFFCIEGWLKGLETEKLLAIDDAGAVGGQTTYEMKILAREAEKIGFAMPHLRLAVALREVSNFLRDPDGEKYLQAIFGLDEKQVKHFLYQTAIVFGQRSIFGGHDRSVA